MFSHKSVFFIVVCFYPVVFCRTKRKECDGFTSSSLAVDSRDYITKLRELTGCQVILHNLIIQRVDDSQISQSQFDAAVSEIEEVYGYVEISFNKLVGEILLPKLRIIRGLEAYILKDGPNKRKIALAIFSNQFRYVALPKLSAVVEHNVVIGNNPGLDCQFGTSIDETQFVGFDEHNLKRFILKVDQYPPRCKCHDSCSAGKDGKRYCWGPRQDQCQTIIRTCPQKCKGVGLATSCYTDDETDEKLCCHSECGTGCTGPGPDNCNDCLHYKDERTQYCVRQCEPLNIITSGNELVKSTNGQYIDQRTCVSHCPENLVSHGQYCLRHCPAGYKRNSTKLDKKCQKCADDDDDCIGECKGDFDVYAVNILRFRGCRKVKGSLRIVNNAFLVEKFYDEHDNVIDTPRLNTTYLYDSLGDIEIITGSLTIQYLPSVPITSLSFLSKLRVVEGKSRGSSEESINIYGPNLVELGLNNLEEVRDGDVKLSIGDQFCYGFDLPWNSLIKNGHQIFSTVDRDGSWQKIKNNCKEQNKTCSNVCDQTNGCYGPGITQCYQCETFKLKQDDQLDSCQAHCDLSDRFFQIDRQTCGKCHDLCRVRVGAETCTGPESTRCLKCDYARLQRTHECVSSCPTGTYLHTSTNSNDDALCLDCNAACGNLGCNGPESSLIKKFVKNGCNSCADLAVRSTEIDGFECINRPDVLKSEMTITQYCRQYVRPSLYQAIRDDLRYKIIDHGYVCDQCSPKCKRCTGDGEKFTFTTTEDAEFDFTGCECKDAMERAIGDTKHNCVDSCNERLFYASAEHEFKKHGFNVCEPCDKECDGCYGSSNRECVHCRNVADFYDSTNSSKFECRTKCPQSKPFDFDKVCSAVDVAAVKQQEATRVKMIAISVGVVVAAVVGVLIFILHKYRHKIQFYKWQEKGEEIELRTDITHAKPNLNQLVTISADQLSKNKQIGSGNYGVVYSGLYRPKCLNFPVAVALKELFADYAKPANQKDVLLEGYKMAKVRHPHCLRLYGICFTGNPTLVTPLMMLGDLLMFVTNNKSKLNGKRLIKYCYQIASAMNHLEQNQIVHRDLAARNVLVKNTDCVCVSDFGLAKLLELGEENIVDKDMKLPFKWLPIESFEKQVFNHKTDVWSFGVTMWEILTFGGKPYDQLCKEALLMGEIPMRRLLHSLRRGDRLSQPQGWLEDAVSRSSFAELEHDLRTKAETPNSFFTNASYALEPDDRSEVNAQRRFTSEYDGDGIGSGVVFDDDFDLEDDASMSLDDGTTGLMATAAMRRPRNSRHTSTNSRYASDPVKYHGTNGYPLIRDTSFGASSTDSNCELMPVDGNDYLVPTGSLGVNSRAASSVQPTRPNHTGDDYYNDPRNIGYHTQPSMSNDIEVIQAETVV